MCSFMVVMSSVRIYNINSLENKTIKWEVSPNFWLVVYMTCTWCTCVCVCVCMFVWVHVRLTVCPFCVKSCCFKAKLSPKCNLGFFCECTRVKSLCESIIARKKTLLRLTIILFFGQNHFFNGSATGNFMLASKLLFFKH